jgi:hypothetical protein
MDQPALWGVPLALGLMFVVSLLTRRRVPLDASRIMLRLHGPEALGFSKDYISEGR